MNLDDSLRDAQVTNGPHDEMSERSQAIKFILRQGTNWPKMSIANKEALENTATRIAMILEGSMDDPHHWNRLARYARLRGKALEPNPREVGLNSVEMALRKMTPQMLTVTEEAAEGEELAAIVEKWAPLK